MFSKKAYENDMWVEMEHNLKKNALQKTSQYEIYKLKALTTLAKAVQELDDLGLHKEASHFLETLELAERDPVTKVTSKQSEDRLKTRGWPLNAADDSDEVSDDKNWKDTSIQEGMDVPKEDTKDTLTDIEVSEDEDSPKDNALCEADLKQLQNIWK